MTNKVLLIAVLGALGVAVVPEILPAGPDAGLDAAGFLESGRFLIGAGVIFVGGLLTAMTPCVYPLIPITVSVFGARKAESRFKAVLLTSAYIFGMGLVFAVLGVVAAKTGALFGSVLADPRFVTGLAVFLLVLASSMFGAFELALPQGLTQRLSSVGGTGLAGAFLMGSVSGFLAAPCTGPILTGLLAFVAQSQSSVLGGGLLFIYALGIGVPFFLIGVFTIQLPKGGAWMEWVKSVLGIALVALALSYLKDAFPPLRAFISDFAGQLGRTPGAAIAALLTLAGVLAGAVHLSFGAGARSFALKTTGVGAVVVALLLRNAAVAAPDTGRLWVDLGWQQPAAQSAFGWDLKFPGPGATELSAFEEVIARARQEGRPVMIDFFAEWCAACKELDHKTFVAAPVKEEARRFITVKIDATNEDDAIEALYKQYGVQGLPTVLFIDSGGQVLKDPKVTGFLNAARFLEQMKKVQ
jgi:thioredoxin:protein disulfide reductase